LAVVFREVRKLVRIAVASAALGFVGPPPAGALDRYRNILFQYQNTTTPQVSILGDFNGWRPEPMKRGARGLWISTQQLSPGRYEYAFLVDSKVVADPWNRNRVHQGRYVVSVIEVHDDALAEKPVSVPEQTHHAERQIEPTAGEPGRQPSRPPTQVSLRTSYSEESTPFWRWTTTLRGDYFPTADLRLRMETFVTRFRDDTGSLSRLSAGFGARQALFAGLYGDAKYRLHKISQASGGDEYHLLVGGYPGHRTFETHIGFRKYPLVDSPINFEDVAFMEGIGSGGSTLDSIRRHLRTHELFGGVGWTPENCYVYLDGTSGRIDDGNRKQAYGTGIGYNLLATQEIVTDQTLYAMLDYYKVGYTQQNIDYYSPLRLVTFTPGLAWRMTLPNGFVVGLEAGRSLSNGNFPGDFGTFLLRVPLTPGLSAETRLQTISDTVYRSRGILVGINGSF
jgi:hypothetical protein